MHPAKDNTPGRANIAVVHTKQEAMEVIERLKADGIQVGDIHIVGKELIQFANLKWDAEINLHRIGNNGDKITSFFTGEEADIEGLKRAKLPENELRHYQEIVESGGVLIYTDEYLDTTRIASKVEDNRNYIDDSLTYDDGKRL